MISTSADTITAWQVEQLDALRMVRRHLTRTGSDNREQLRALVAEYLSFRRDLDAFLAAHFSHVCPQWSLFKDKERIFKWPDRAVLFDDLEELFFSDPFNTAVSRGETDPDFRGVNRDGWFTKCKVNPPGPLY